MNDICRDDGDSMKADECLTVMATRIATVFASLRVCNLLSNPDILCYEND